MTRGNCLLWAVRQWMRHGGRLRFRRSPSRCAIRVEWSDYGLHWYAFTPDHPKKFPAYCWHKLWFRGRVRRVR